MKKNLSTTLCAMIAALLCAILPGIANAAGPEPGLYYIRHAVHNADAPDVDIGSVGFHHATLSKEEAGGRRVHIKPLWIRAADGLERDAGSAALDPQVPLDAEIIAVMHAGFLSAIAPSGEPGPLQSADSQAFGRLKRRDGSIAERQLQMSQAAGLRPMPLPSGLRAGQHLRVPMRLEPYGPLVAEAQVLEVSPEDVLLTLKVAGKALRGTGRAAVRLSDGMPIELRMRLESDARASIPASRHDVHLADMRHAPHLEMAQDLAMYQDYVAQIQQTLMSAPFGGSQSDPAMYSLTDIPVGALQPHMVASEALPDLERNMGFAWVPAAGRGAAALAIGARARLSRGPADEAVLVARVGPVQALDATGEVLADIVAQSILPQLYLGDRFTASEHEPGFPFRLPVGLAQPARERIHTLRMPVMAEVYSWHSEETVSVHQPSSVNAGVELELSAPTRLSVVHARSPQRASVGLWTVAVPLDADGKEIPARQLSILPITIKGVETLDELPLAWESRNVPYRVEIAAQAPIHQLQLRHYLWTLEPRMWAFRKLQ